MNRHRDGRGRIRFVQRRLEQCFLRNPPASFGNASYQAKTQQMRTGGKKLCIESCLAARECRTRLEPGFRNVPLRFRTARAP
jgi:hypothetical protein